MTTKATRRCPSGVKHRRVHVDANLLSRLADIVSEDIGAPVSASFAVQIAATDYIEHGGRE